MTGANKDCTAQNSAKLNVVTGEKVSRTFKHHLPGEEPGEHSICICRLSKFCVRVMLIIHLVGGLA